MLEKNDEQLITSPVQRTIQNMLWKTNCKQYKRSESFRNQTTGSQNHNINIPQTVALTNYHTPLSKL